MDKIWEYIAAGGFLVLLRLWSSIEHGSTKKDINEIKKNINGDLLKRLNETFENGKREGIRLEKERKRKK